MNQDGLPGEGEEWDPTVEDWGLPDWGLWVAVSPFLVVIVIALAGALGTLR